MTSEAERSIAERLIGKGPVRFVPKPIHPLALIQRMREALDPQSRHTGPRAVPAVEPGPA
jgi:hypothetical protein